MDKRRAQVWIAMADHFLDTETRHDIPRTAFISIAAGFCPEEAHEIWQNEVSPAVSFNAWDVAGEWAGWDEHWLVTEIGRVRAKAKRRSKIHQWLRDHVYPQPLSEIWVAIERCMLRLLEVKDPSRQEQMSRDLTILARHYFDFAIHGDAALEPDAHVRLSALYPEPFQYIMEPVLVSGEAQSANERIRVYLAQH